MKKFLSNLTYYIGFFGSLIILLLIILLAIGGLSWLVIRLFSILG